MLEFLKTKNFHMFFSFLLGIFVVIVFKKTCKGDDCIEHKNPNIDEINKLTYQIGSKCYQFRSQSI
jgi:hypothetical protein